MSTDPRLPDTLSTAAGKVDQVTASLVTLATAAQTQALQGIIGWSGPRSSVWGPATLKVARELTTEAGMTRDLSGALRRAAKSASQRLYWEQQAREAAQRKAEAAAAAAKKAQGTK